MREIEELVTKIKKYNNVIVQKKYSSKKNTVAYVTIKGKPRILKWYTPGFKPNMLKEYNILKKGEKKLQIPYVFEIDKTNNVIILNHIITKLLPDMSSTINRPITGRFHY